MRCGPTPAQHHPIYYHDHKSAASYSNTLTLQYLLPRETVKITIQISEYILKT